MENSNYRGKLGEDFVASFLEEKGHMIVRRNYHTRDGEIDIISKEEGRLHFIEVKTRLLNSIAEPSEFVDAKKQRKMILAALGYFNETGEEIDASFDVYEVICEKNAYFKVKTLKIHRNAFDVNEENSKGLNL